MKPLAKNEAIPDSMDEYIARVPEPARATLNRIRVMIRAAAPREATETISYRIPTFQYKGPLIGFAAFSKHCGLYVMSLAVMEEFKTELVGFETSKGTIRFPLDKPPAAALVKKLVKARVAENVRKKRR